MFKICSFRYTFQYQLKITFVKQIFISKLSSKAYHLEIMGL